MRITFILNQTNQCKKEQISINPEEVYQNLIKGTHFVVKYI